MLRIDDLRKLKITKVVDNYKIFFTYDGERYLLHRATEDYDDYTTLYKRVPGDRDGFFFTEAITYQYGDGIPFLECYGKSMCYSKIRLDRFVWDLTRYKLIESYYSEEVKRRERIKSGIRREIRALEEKFRALDEL